MTEPNNGNARCGSYTPSKIIGSAEAASANGLNHPPSTFLSSAKPTRKASEVVMIIASIAVEGKKAYSVSSEARIHARIEGPPGRATIVATSLL